MRPWPRWTVLLGLACAGVASGRDAIRIDGAGVYPESLTSSADGTIYVGSLGGTIYRARPKAQVAEPWIRRTNTNGLLSIFGVLADDRRGVLWVCTSPAELPGGVREGRPAVLQFALRSGARVRFAPLPGARSVCDDIAVARDGTAYIGDIGEGAIWRLAAHSSLMTLYAKDKGLAGLDGIALAEDGTLYVDSITQNRILRVERQVDGSFAGLTIIATSAPLLGPDGLRPIAHNRFALAEGRSGKIDEVTISGDSATIRVLGFGLQSPAGVTFSHGWVYAPDGKIGYLFDPRLRGQDPGAFYIHAFLLDTPKPRS